MAYLLSILKAFLPVAIGFFCLILITHFLTEKGYAKIAAAVWFITLLAVGYHVHG